MKKYNTKYRDGGEHGTAILVTDECKIKNTFLEGYLTVFTHCIQDNHECILAFNDIEQIERVENILAKAKDELADRIISSLTDNYLND